MGKRCVRFGPERPISFFFLLFVLTHIDLQDTVALGVDKSIKY